MKLYTTLVGIQEVITRYDVVHMVLIWAGRVETFHSKIQKFIQMRIYVLMLIEVILSTDPHLDLQSLLWPFLMIALEDNQQLWSVWRCHDY